MYKKLAPYNGRNADGSNEVHCSLTIELQAGRVFWLGKES